MNEPGGRGGGRERATASACEVDLRQAPFSGRGNARGKLASSLPLVVGIEVEKAPLDQVGRSAARELARFAVGVEDLEAGRIDREDGVVGGIEGAAVRHFWRAQT